MDLVALIYIWDNLFAALLCVKIRQEENNEKFEIDFYELIIFDMT